MAVLDDMKTEKGPNDDITSPSASDRGIDNISSPVNVQTQPKRSWKSYIWDTFDKSPEERRFLFKLDFALMTLASLGYFIKYLDQVNINNAFVSGMKEDLQLYGNELNYMQTSWTVGYVIGELPSNLLLTRIRPRYWIPFCEYIIGSWYRKDELAKRSCLFHAMGNVGSMVSGYLMAGSHSLNGMNGWQWLFITNTVVSLPIALVGFFFLPDIPEINTAWYFTPDAVALAKRRMELEGRATRQPFTKKKVANIFSTWHIYMLVLLYIVFNNGNGGNSQPAFQLWLKSEHYGVREVNLYPTLTEVISIVTTLIYAWTSDTVFHGARWPPIVFSGLVKILAYGRLTAWNIPDGFKWAHEICHDDTEKRAIVTGSMNMMAYVFQAWLPLLIWQQVEAAQYPKGYSTTLGLAMLLIATAMAIRFLHKRDTNE
ncbi:major facilitator superfamily transporter [Apiospora saccharicola]|uniref:Major facilitator superfamily transporter n=1 Tax=Apiospora saccharicola TaxID=335842 RepID=A0ABR1UE68_9PEZI